MGTLIDRKVVSGGTLAGQNVVNPKGESLGNVKELMLDITTGHIAYVVISFGGFLGMGDKLFAVPFSRFALDAENEQWVLDVKEETLEDAPGFDKNNWPDMGVSSFGSTIHTHYGVEPYWNSPRL